MNSQNVCKWILSKDQGQLVTAQFVHEHNSPFVDNPGTLDLHVLYLVASGEGTFCSSGFRWPLSVGTVFFSFSDTPFSFEDCRELEFYYISFRGSRAEDLFRRFGITPVSCVFDGCEGLLPHWQESLTRANDEDADLLTESLLYYTFSRLKKTKQADSALVTFVLSYLDEHFTESTLSLTQVAEAAGYHKKYLSYEFKKQFGTGLSKYLQILRIRYAIMLMENGVTSVKNVAALSGFSDPLYFSKVFAEMVGISPSQYQKNGGIQIPAKG